MKRTTLILALSLAPALAAKDKTTFLDIGAQFLESDGTLPKTLMSDGTHPSDAGYKIWATALQDAGVGQRVCGSFQLDLGLTDFHAFAFSKIQDRSRLVDARDQVINPRSHHPGRGKSFVAIRVAVDAERALLRADHRVAGFRNGMIAVTGDALAKLLVVEGLLVRTGLK